jgi:peroxiredoxin Q/BCP
MKKLLFLIVFIVLGNSLSAQGTADFTLMSATNDRQFTLSKAKGKFVALHFLLKTECPYCIRHTQDYLDKAPKLPDVIQVFVKPDTDEEIKEWATNLPSGETSGIPIYRDPEAKLADRFKIPNGYQFHGQVVHYPALILLDPDGNEVFRYIGKDNSDRFPFEKLEAKIAELKRETERN